MTPHNNHHQSTGPHTKKRTIIMSSSIRFHKVWWILMVTLYQCVSVSMAFIPSRVERPSHHSLSFMPQQPIDWRTTPTRSSGTTTTITKTLPTPTSLHMDIIGVSPEPIHSAFALATFGPQPFWLLMILLPKNDITKKIMGPMDVVIFFALLHFFIVGTSIGEPDATAPLIEFNDVFDPSKDTQAAFMNMVTNYPNFVAEEWPHVLTWDLFVGRWVWLDGLQRGIFTRHSVLFCNLIGPPGLLLHWITCLITGKGFGSNEADGIAD